MAGLRPGTSPPPVRMPITPFLTLVFAIGAQVRLRVDYEPTIIHAGGNFRKGLSGIQISTGAGWKSEISYWNYYGSMRVPKTVRNFASHAGCAGQAGAVTRLPSTS